MNSYHTNRIEGQHTRPRESEQASRKEFSDDPNLASRQRLAVAHIDAERAIERRYAGLDGAATLRPEAVLDIHSERCVRSGVLRESLRPLHYLYSTGAELERGEFKSMMALGDRTAVSALAALLKRGFRKSDTLQGKVRFALPLHALRFYFPALWPEAEADPG